MKSKIVYSGIAIVALLIINALSLIRIADLKKYCNSMEKKKQHQALADSITIASLIANQNLLSQNSSFRINPNLQVLTEDGVKLLLSDVCDGNKKLIFRYNEFACSPCIFEEMGNINTLAQKIGKKTS